MNNLQIFSYNGCSTRTIQDDSGIWFVAKDIAEALDYSMEGSITSLFAHVPAIWAARKRIAVRSENGVEQARDMLCLTEQGVYFFLGRSDKPKALPYQMWIAGDVVPQIRRTGSYSLNKEQPALPAGVLDGARLIFETAGIKDNQLTLALDKVYKSYTGRSALQAGEVSLEAPVKEQLLSPTEIAQHFGFTKPKAGARFINKLLEEAGYQRKVGGMRQPLEPAMSFAVMLDTNKKHSDGTPVRQLKWNTGIIQVIDAFVGGVNQ